MFIVNSHAQKFKNINQRTIRMSSSTAIILGRTKISIIHSELLCKNYLRVLCDFYI